MDAPITPLVAVWEMVFEHFESVAHQGRIIVLGDQLVGVRSAGTRG
jgi:hypothetical protein